MEARSISAVCEPHLFSHLQSVKKLTLITVTRTSNLTVIDLGALIPTFTYFAGIRPQAATTRATLRYKSQAVHRTISLRMHIRGASFLNGMLPDVSLPLEQEHSVSLCRAAGLMTCPDVEVDHAATHAGAHSAPVVQPSSAVNDCTL